MDGQERAYFRLVTGRKSKDKNYVRLFDAIHKCEQYDEREIKSSLSGTKRIIHFKRLKSYLTEEIISAVSEYHSGVLVKSRVRNKIAAIEILTQKKLYERAERIAASTEELCIKHQLHAYLLIVKQMRYSLQPYHRKFKITKKQIAHHYNGSYDLLKEYSNYLQYREIYDQIALIGRDSIIFFEKSVRMQLNAILRNPLLANSDRAHSFEAKKLFYDAKALIYGKLSDWNAAALNFKNCIALHETLQLSLPEQITNYLIANYNFLLCLTNLKDHAAFYINSKKIIDLFEKLPNSHKSKVNLNWYIKILVLELSNLQAENSMEKLLQRFHSLDRLFVKTNFSDLQTKSIVYYKLFLMHFEMKAYRKAIGALNKINSLGYSDQTKEVFEMSLLLSVICHYEMKNYDLLPYLSNSAIKQIQKRGEVRKYQLLLLQFLDSDLEEKYSKGAFISLREKLQRVLKDKNELNALRAFDFLAWIEKKCSL